MLLLRFHLLGLNGTANPLGGCGAAQLCFPLGMRLRIHLLGLNGTVNPLGGCGAAQLCFSS